MQPEKQLEGKANYFLGSPSNWRAGGRMANL
jgi:hypothetical protein